MIQVTHIKSAFTDKRGIITHLMDVTGEITSVLFITSKRGAIRANHYHKKDIHHVYLISGEFEYSEKKVKGKDLIETVTIKPGDLVKTNPMTIHAMKFTKISSMIVLTTESRNQDHYEKDTVRIELVP